MYIAVLLLPALLCVIGLAVPLGTVVAWRRYNVKHIKRTPLTVDLLRPPGHSTRHRVNEIREECDLYIILAILLLPIALVVHFFQLYFLRGSGSMTENLVLAAAVFCGYAFLGTKVWSTLGHYRNCRLGLEGEMFVGEELNQLMLSGCRVFHDVQFPHGNIDHVVVSKSGLYAVETKMIGKMREGPRRAEVVVDNRKGLIEFPNHTYAIDRDQLESQRRWLSGFLSNAIAESVKAESILAIPGWFIARRDGPKNDVYVISPRNPLRFFVNNRTCFTDKQIQMIAHQLEQLCRDVEPSFQ